MVPTHRTSPVVAVLLPVSQDAFEILKLRRNASKIDYAGQFSTEHPHGHHFKQLGIVIDVASFLGRACVPFGSSRSAPVQLPPGQDVNDQHFILLIDPATRSLHIKDTSATGVWVSSATSSAQYRLLYHAAASVTTSLHLQFGDNGRFRFELWINEDALASAISTYLTSVTAIAPAIAHTPPPPNRPVTAISESSSHLQTSQKQGQKRRRSRVASDISISSKRQQCSDVPEQAHN